MRILWVAGSCAGYNGADSRGTGGWIGAAAEALRRSMPDIELGIAFFHPTDNTAVVRDGVTYMPVAYNWGRNNLERLWIRHCRDKRAYRNSRVEAMCKVAREFRPDVMHIWGIEGYHSRVVMTITDIPHVVHIQGLCSAYLYAYCPPGLSFREIEASEGLASRLLKRGAAGHLAMFRDRAANELEVGPHVRNWMGRTSWDCTMASALSPQSRYFHCEEMIRTDFSGDTWKYHHDGETTNIVSTISDDWYKGMDVVLETARVLSAARQNIRWHIYGWSPASRKLAFFSRKLVISPEEVGVVCHGSVGAAELKRALLDADCYVHPSYIENSSNAIAEAMLTGLPVVAQHVGGNATMLKDDSGMLVPPHEPYILSAAIIRMTDKDTAEAYSRKALAVGRARQDTATIVKTMTDIYRIIRGKELHP